MISWFVPIRSGVWIFGAVRGGKYIDNTRHLFERLSQEGELFCAWLSKDKAIVQELRKAGFKAYPYFSLQGLWFAMTAEAAFYTHRGNLRNGDLPFFALNSRCFRVQTWHGIPLKKIAYDDRLFSFTDDERSLRFRIRLLIERLFPFLTFVKTPHLILALSEETKKIFSGAFRVHPDTVAITGYPRNDCLFREPETDDGGRKIIYMPTFRGGEGTCFDPLAQFGFELERFESVLREKDLQFFIKLHPFNLPSPEMQQKIVRSDRVFLLECDDIYPTLNQYGLLVTDYSSVYFDFLLLNRPIVFTLFDHSKYLSEDRELYYPYEDVTPGPKVESWNEFLDLLQSDHDFYTPFIEQAALLRDRFHLYQDGASAERVHSEVKNRLQGDRL